jgi:hypothetical protein
MCAIHTGVPKLLPTSHLSGCVANAVGRAVRFVRPPAYQAESPDEAALVVAAKAFGFFFFKRTNTSVTVRENTAAGVHDVEYEVLNVLEFNSTRKRMSVVIKNKLKDQILILTKGADTVIYERLDPSYAPNEAMKASTTEHMEQFGAAGLRTLCLSYAEVDREWYANEWQPLWVEAKTSLDNRDHKVGVGGRGRRRQGRGCCELGWWGRRAGLGPRLAWAVRRVLLDRVLLASVCVPLCCAIVLCRRRT